MTLSNISFTEFKTRFNNTFSDVADFIDKVESGNGDFLFDCKLVKTEDEDQSDNSYDYTDTKKTRIFFFPQYNIYVKFEGRDKSYDGESWEEDFVEVKPTTTTVQEYEQINGTGDN